MTCQTNELIKKYNLDLNINCTNEAKHSDGSNNFCPECWENLHDPKFDYFV